jgi:LmbE family N-acetylglucosaminyl deacetylase
VLVFAPHPDDETIAAGGLLARLTRSGTPVRVVFVTSGDGYPRAVREELRARRPTDTDYTAMGELRKREATAAAARLGLRPGDLVFLGFPDGGLARLWNEHWSRSHPYTSPYTKEDSPPTPEGVEYDGQDLTSIIADVLRRFRPTVVVIPHPYDDHLDHAHTSYFVIEAVDSLQGRHVLPDDLVVLTYLVHDGGWPPPGGNGRGALPPPPPAKIPDTLWSTLDLAPPELAAKQAALAEYRTQLAVLGDFLHSFCRRNELFGRVKSSLLSRIAAVH